MFQDPSLFLFLFRDAAEAVTKKIIQTCAEFKACIWMDKEICDSRGKNSASCMNVFLSP